MKKLQRGVAALSAILIAAAGPVYAALTQGDSSDSWRERLTASDLDAREQSFDACLEAMRRDPDLRETVQGWSEGTGELAWTGRLLLRELEREEAWPFGSSGSLAPFGNGGFDPLGPDFDRWLNSLGFDRTPFGPHGFGAGPGSRFSPGTPGLGNGSAHSNAQSFKLEETPDGVKVEITQEEDGNLDTKTYEADSLEELLKEHPELRQHIAPLSGGPAGRAFSFGFGGGQPWSVPGFSGGAQRMRTDRLGVLVSPPAQGSKDSGLSIQRVFPGSLGEALGLAPGDVLRELCGTQVSTPEDVARALAARADGDPVRARIERNGDERTLEWTPSAAGDDGARLLLEGPTRRL